MPNKRMSIDQRFNYLGIQYNRYKEATSLWRHLCDGRPFPLSHRPSVLSHRPSVLGSTPSRRASFL